MSKRHRGERKPYTRVYIEITNICNMSCSFCPGHKRAPRAMSEREFLKVLDSVAPFTDYVYLHLMGEPLTHPKILDFIALARGKGFKPMITTNGTRLAAMGEALAASGLYKVNISLHSFEKNDENKQKQYLTECCDFADKASKNGTLVTYRLWNGGAGVDNDLTLDYLHTRYGEWVENRSGYKLSERVYLDFAQRFGWPDREGELLGSDVYCYGLYDHFGILSDGTVVPCCLDKDGEIALGNIFDTELKDILDSPRARAITEGFRNRNAPEELCRRCPYARRF